MPTIHHLDAETISVESDECGFELHVTDTDGDVHVFNIQAAAVDLLSAVERTIAPWHREGMAVYAEWRAAGAFSAYDPSDAYDLSDPKHPRYHSVHADMWDARAGK